MDETLDSLHRIAYDDRIVGLDREDARRLYNKAASHDASSAEFARAAELITDIARKNRLHDLGRAALESKTETSD